MDSLNTRSRHIPGDRETQRTAELARLRILDTAPERDFDVMGRAAAALFNTPIALVSLVDTSRQWFKVAHGLTIRETPRNVSFCSYAIERPTEVMVVPDALSDHRFARSPLVTGAPNIRFYAGAPLVTSTGHAIGTVCVIDRRPRELSAEELQALRQLAGLAARLIELGASDRLSQAPRRRLTAPA